MCFFLFFSKLKITLKENHWLFEDDTLDDLAIAIDRIFSDKYFPYQNDEQFYTNLINIITKLMFSIITKNFDKVNAIFSNIPFIYSFESLVNFVSKFKRINISKENIDFAYNLGAFGKSTISRRFSAFFCSGLIRMNKTVLTDLVKRINILDSDYERVIRIEIAHQLRYLIKEIGDVFCDNRTFELVKMIFKLFFR